MWQECGVWSPPALRHGLKRKCQVGATHGQRTKRFFVRLIRGYPLERTGCKSLLSATDSHNRETVSLRVELPLVFLAKVIALSLFVVLCNIAINGVPTLLFPGSVLVTSVVPGSAGSTIRPGDLPRYHLSHAVSLFLSSLFVFTSLVSLRALLLLICPAKLVSIVSRRPARAAMRCLILPGPLDHRT